MNQLEQAVIGQLVAGNYHTAAVFKQFNIDFCCKGNMTVGEACRLKNIDPALVTDALENVQPVRRGDTVDFSSWGADVLASHIQQTHHTYVARQIPVLESFLHKLCGVHGAAHPELLTVNRLFLAAADELTHHMQKEEVMLFPYIRRLVQASQDGNTPAPPPFGSVQAPIAVMMQEHSQEGDRFQQMTELSNDFTPPADACNTYRVTYGLLKEFRDDLHLHIHLENNILFLKAAQLEDSLRNTGASCSIAR